MRPLAPQPKSLILKDLQEVKSYILGLTRGSVYAILIEVMGRYIHTKCTYVENHAEGTYTFTGPCKKTGKPYSVTIPGNELWDLNQGELLQVALKSLNADDREFAASGYSPEGWNEVFA